MMKGRFLKEGFMNAFRMVVDDIVAASYVHMMRLTMQEGSTGHRPTVYRRKP